MCHNITYNNLISYQILCYLTLDAFLITLLTKKVFPQLEGHCQRWNRSSSHIIVKVFIILLDCTSCIARSVTLTTLCLTMALNFGVIRHASSMTVLKFRIRISMRCCSRFIRNNIRTSFSPSFSLLCPNYQNVLCLFVWQYMSSSLSYHLFLYSTLKFLKNIIQLLMQLLCGGANRIINGVAIAEIRDVGRCLYLI